MRLGVDFHVREVEGGSERDGWGKGDGGCIRDGGCAGDRRSGGQGRGGRGSDSIGSADSGGGGEMPGSLRRICIGLGQVGCGEEGASDKGNREDQENQQAFDHCIDCSLNYSGCDPFFRFISHGNSR